MDWKLSKSNYPLLIMAVFAAGLVVAGGLLYRWINQASVADREQQVDFLNAAMRSFRGEFVTPLLEIRATFRPMPRAGTPAALDQYLAGFYSQWKSSDANGALVSSLSVGIIRPDGKLQFQTLDSSSGKFKQEAWPESLQMFRPGIEEISGHETGRVIFYRANGFPFALIGDRPVIMVPLVEAGGRGFDFRARALGGNGPQLPEVFAARVGRGIGPQPPGVKAPAPPPAPAMGPPMPGRLRGWCFLELDLSYLKQHVLPQLVERSFGDAGLSSYQVAILAGDPQKVVYSSRPGLAVSSFSSPDGQTLLFAAFGEREARFRARVWRRQHRAHEAERGGVSAAAAPPQIPPGPVTAGFERQRLRQAGAWVLSAKNKAGSIDALVARTRRRNLALGFGVLLVLAFSMGSLVISTHRARELARREMEFVAGVSHEFRTPLASIQSAGYNLASGVVRKSSRVREYGALVQNEARRLTDLIEQVMSYAGIQSGGKRYEVVPLEVPAMVDRALAEYGPAFRDAGWQVEKQVEENLPPVMAEASSVESAVKNLLANAMKYSGPSRWLRVCAVHVPDGGRAEVQVSVEDRGPGIDPADLPHIFEPFYRGRQVLASTVPGAGLGLSIVKRHLEAQGGRVSVESVKGKGSRFTLHLPVVQEPGGKAV